jgi:hypothetical protein
MNMGGGIQGHIGHHGNHASLLAVSSGFQGGSNNHQNMVISGNATGINSSGVSVGQGANQVNGTNANQADYKMKHNSSNHSIHS